MNTGHRGSLTTIHAKNAPDALFRSAQGSFEH
ncbi:Flp pilus assembly complex ATPase component [Edaphobacter sp. 12200R-103]|nr:Flp pilus assembly complex ATPase component [Edaphobacter sp. 12200R-103]